MKKITALSGNKIKMIAVLSMLVDHFSKTVLIVLLNLYSLPRLNGGTMTFDSYNAIVGYITTYLYGFGRIAFPLFCFLIAEGFYYTKNRLKYLISMAVFALLSEIPYDLLLRTSIFDISKQNVYFTLFLGVASLWVMDNKLIKSKPLEIVTKAVAVGIIAISANYLHTDYGTKGVLYIITFYLFRSRRLVQAAAFLMVYAFMMRSIPSVFIVLSTMIMLMYNGERGTLRVNKYVFYAFYPVHLLVLWFIVTFLYKFF